MTFEAPSDHIAHETINTFLAAFLRQVNLIFQLRGI